MGMASSGGAMARFWSAGRCISLASSRNLHRNLVPHAHAYRTFQVNGCTQWRGIHGMGSATLPPTR